MRLSSRCCAFTVVVLDAGCQVENGKQGVAPLISAGSTKGVQRVAATLGEDQGQITVDYLAACVAEAGAQDRDTLSGDKGLGNG